MTYVLPTALEFKTRHATFAAVGDATVNAFILEASASVSQCWAEADYQPAIMYLAAHMIAEETSGGGPKAASKSGAIKRVKADSVEIEYAASAGSDASLGTTVYGRRFLALRTRNAPRAITV